MNILSFFIPSWRFFDRFGYIPKLHIQIIDTGQKIEFKAPPLKINRMLFNPQGNDYLYKISCLQRFIEGMRVYDQISHEQIEKLSSFQNLNKIIQNEIHLQLRTQSPYQFQILIFSNSIDDEFYQSEVQKW